MKQLYLIFIQDKGLIKYGNQEFYMAQNVIFHKKVKIKEEKDLEDDITIFFKLKFLININLKFSI